LLAAQLSDAAGIHLHLGVIIFVDMDGSAEYIGNHPGNTYYAIMEVFPNGRVECVNMVPDAGLESSSQNNHDDVPAPPHTYVSKNEMTSRETDMQQSDSDAASTTNA
jgi:hypothetical protein